MEIIGHDNTKKQLRVAAISAQTRNYSLPHMLFAGAAGCGKTSLARYVAETAGYPFLNAVPNDMKDRASVRKILSQLDHSNYDEKGNATGKLSPTILFFDEIHNMPPKGQELFGVVMERFITESNIPNKVTWVPFFTIIGATTVPGKLTKPFREKFKMFFTFQPYINDDMFNIVSYHAKRLNIVVIPEVVTEIVKRSRGIPRIAVGFVERLRDLMIALNVNLGTPYIVRQLFKSLKIDDEGCTETEIKILKALSEVNGPVGLENLSIITEIDQKSLRDYVEPFLIRKGLILVTGKGRILTTKGNEYIEERALTHIKKKDVDFDYERKTFLSASS